MASGQKIVLLHVFAKAMFGQAKRSHLAAQRFDAACDKADSFEDIEIYVQRSAFN